MSLSVGILPLWIVLYNIYTPTSRLDYLFSYLTSPLFQVYLERKTDSNASGAHRTCTIQSDSEVNLIFVVVVVFEKDDLVVSATLQAQVIELFFLLN